LSFGKNIKEIRNKTGAGVRLTTRRIDKVENMKRIALFVFNGDPMCFIHVLLNAKAWNDHGHEVKIIIEGTATTLVPEVAKEDNPLHKLWEACRKDGLVAGACRACSQKLGVADGIKSQDLDLLEGIAGHPGMVQYQEDGFDIITF